MSAVQGKWPSDADGDVLRRLQASGFDFASEHVIDFNIDFASWPPPNQLVAELERRYRNVVFFEPEGAHQGYIRVQLCARISYELVTSAQREMSELARPFGGICDSWGVMQQ